MKIKYLALEGRQTLHRLRNTSDLAEIAEILEEMLKRPFTIHALWEYRKWFYMLTQEELRKYPVLSVGYSQIHVMAGELKRARKMVEALPEDSYYHLLTTLVMPGIEKEERQEAFQKIKEHGYAPIPNLTLTAGRPSVLNGLWDFTPYMDVIVQDKETVLSQLQSIFGEQAHGIYDIALAECLYYQNKCYEALVIVVSIIPFLADKQDMRLLFVALTLEIFILTQNGQIPSTVPMMQNLRTHIKDVGVEEYLPNIDALDAWCAMYDGDYIRLAKWMKEGSPDEYGKFCMLDTFRYMIKLRTYIIQGKYLAVTALATRLLPLLEEGKRYMDCCELHMIWAMSDFADKRKKEAFGHLKAALELSEAYHYDRLIADEGKRMCDLLKAYRTEETQSAYLDRIIELAESSSALYPRYLKNQLPEKPELSKTELRILRLLQDSYTNAQISAELDIALETAKKHCKNICKKLEVRNRHQAVQRAVEFGIIEQTNKGAIPNIKEKRNNLISCLK